MFVAKTLKEAIVFLIGLVRWNHWYESKIPLFFILGYYLLIIYWQGIGSLVLFTRLVLFTIFFLAFGYTLNDFCDRDVDRKAGKLNIVSGLRPIVGIVIILIIFLLGVIALPFHSLRTIIIVLLCYFFMTFYSLPPLRFKERGVLGMLVAASAQRTLPALVFFDAFDHWGLDALLICILYLFVGLRWIIGHQIWDLDNDRRAGVETYTTNVGPTRMEYILKFYVFPIEFVLLVATILSWRGSSSPDPVRTN